MIGTTMRRSVPERADAAASRRLFQRRVEVAEGRREQHDLDAETGRQVDPDDAPEA